MITTQGIVTAGVTIDGYLIDAAVSEDHGAEAEITDFPVERGPDVSDCIRAKPRTVTIEGIVSNTPFGRMVAERAKSTTLPAQDALALFDRIRAQSKLVTVETSLRVYEDMGLESVSFTVDKSTGDALAFSATFCEVILVSNKRVSIRVAVPRGAGKRDLGNKNGKNIQAADHKRFIYDEDTGQIIGEEEVKWDGSADGGRGQFLREDGRTPLSQEEVDQFNSDIEDSGADAAFDENNPRTRWHDKDGRPLTQVPNTTLFYDDELNQRQPWSRDSRDTRGPSNGNPGDPRLPTAGFNDIPTAPLPGDFLR